MRIVYFLITGFAFLTLASCGNNEESTEVIVKDSLGITTGAPLTGHVDSAAADTAASVTISETPATEEPKSTPAPAGVETRVEKLTGANGEEITATYNKNEQMSLVTLQLPGEDPVRLMQTGGDATNGEYSNGKIVWTTAGSGATLAKDGKTTQFNVKK